MTPLASAHNRNGRPASTLRAVAAYNTPADRLRDEFCAILGSIGRYRFGSASYVRLWERACLLKAQLREQGEPLQMPNTFDADLPIHSAHDSHSPAERL